MTTNETRYSTGFADGMLYDAQDPNCRNSLRKMEAVIKAAVTDDTISTPDIAYAHGYRDGVTESHPLTLEQAKNLRHGQQLYEIGQFNRDGSPVRWRVNGQIKLWKRSPERFRLPVKYGLKTCEYITEANMHLLTASEEYAKAFVKPKPKTKLVRKYISWEDKEGFMVEVAA